MPETFGTQSRPSPARPLRTSCAVAIVVALGALSACGGSATPKHEATGAVPTVAFTSSNDPSGFSYCLNPRVTSLVLSKRLKVTGTVTLGKPTLKQAAGATLVRSWVTTHRPKLFPAVLEGTRLSTTSKADRLAWAHRVPLPGARLDASSPGYVLVEVKLDKNADSSFSGLTVPWTAGAARGTAVVPEKVAKKRHC